jgi:hypothetical protein
MLQHTVRIVVGERKKKKANMMYVRVTYNQTTTKILFVTQSR